MCFDGVAFGCHDQNLHWMVFDGFLAFGIG